MKKLFWMMLVSVMIVGSIKVTYAQGESAVPFLLVAPDSRAGGMGESGGGLADNSSAIFWNPAGIAFLTGSEVNITHSNWLPQFNLDLFYDYLTFRKYVEDLDGSITASVTYMNFGEFVRTGPDDPTPLGVFRSFDAAATIGYATKLSDNWGIGLNFRVIHSKLSDQPTAAEQGSGTATSVSFDIATMWRPDTLDLPLLGDLGGKFSLGINLSNLGPKISYIDRAQADPIPTNLRIGFAYQILNDDFNSLMVTADFTKLMVVRDSSSSKEFYEAIFNTWTNKSFSETIRSFTTAIGLEYWYGTPGEFLFALRTGYFYEDPSYGNRKFITFGAGIRYDIYGFDFSYLTTSVFPDGENQPLNDTLRFTVSIGWGNSSQQASRGLPRGI